MTSRIIHISKAVGIHQGTAIFSAAGALIAAAIKSGSADFPMSFDDPMFTGMTNSGEVSLAADEDISNLSFSNNTDTVEIICGGGTNNITLCRTFSREGIRIGSDGVVNIDRCWIETYGVDLDHADGLQTFPADVGDINITNTTFRSYSPGVETVPPPGNVQSVGIFYADGYGGNISLDNVLFRGGHHAFRIHADLGATVNVSLNRVYLVGPFGSFSWSVTEEVGTLNVVNWTDVFEATIVNGVVVPGDAIPPP